MNNILKIRDNKTDPKGSTLPFKFGEEAIAYLEKNWKNMPFPKSAEYICDSEELDTEGEITITPNNGEE